MFYHFHYCIMKLKPVFKLYSTLIFIAAITSACSGDRSEEKPTLRNVFLTQPVSLSHSSSTTYSGVIEEGASVNAAFMADGKISKISVKEGDRVRKGQLLASLDDADYRLGVAQLEAQYNQMTKEKVRMDAMFEKHNIAPNDYEKFTTGYEQVKLQLDMARRKLGYTRLYAPSDGYIASKYLNDGELAGAGTPVVNIVDDSHLVAAVDLPVSVYLDKDKIVSATGHVPGVTADIPLKTLSFTPDVDNNMLYHLKLSLPANVGRELSPGMNISVDIEYTDSQTAGFRIPSRAIFSEKGKSYVWVYDAENSTIYKKEVGIIGKPTGADSTVEGLGARDRIVEVAVKQLYDGEKVNVINRKDLGL